MFDHDTDLIDNFVTESRAGLDEIEGDLLALESAGSHFDPDRVNKIFRAVHSIKGASGFLGLHVIGGLAHGLENVLDRLRTRDLAADSQRVDTMLQAADELRDLIDNIETSNERDISRHLAALSGVGNAGPAIVTGGKQVFKLQFDALGDPEIHRDAVEFVRRLQDVGDVLRGTLDFNIQPQPDNVQPQPARWTVWLSTVLDRSTLCRFFRLSDDRIQAAGSVGNAGELSRFRMSSSPVAAENSICVPVTVLNRLESLASELAGGRNQLLQTVGTGDQQALNSVAARLDQLTHELQAAISQTRLQPLGSVFDKFKRLVRDLGQRLGKPCRLVIDSEEIALDRATIAAIRDSLTHLIRNAVDHGIEDAARRRAAGKEPVGTVELRAFNQRGQIHLVIRDDGAGIDVALLRRKAVEAGLLTDREAEALSDHEAVRLTFHPGFSTAATVSDVSGRGVGMDVVKTNVERLGGTVDLDTALGRGTTVTVCLPLLTGTAFS